MNKYAIINKRMLIESKTQENRGVKHNGKNDLWLQMLKQYHY